MRPGHRRQGAPPDKTPTAPSPWKSLQSKGRGLRHLIAVCLLECVAYAGLATHTAWATQQYGDGRPDVLGLCVGHAEISVQASKRGWPAPR